MGSHQEDRVAATRQGPPTRPRIDKAQIVRALTTILEPGQVTEVRALEATIGSDRYAQTLTGYFNDTQKLADEAAKITSAKAIYFIPNVIDPALLARAANRIKPAKKDPLTSDQNITRRRWLLIDADPTRPAGISSTDEEHDAALARIEQIEDQMTAAGWPKPIKADSGNGGHLMYPIDEPADDDGLIQRCLEALAGRFTDEKVKIDTTVYNPARIWKLYGTPACKGDSTPDRPHRLAKLILVPDQIGVVSHGQIVTLADTAPTPPTPTPPSSYQASPGANRNGQGRRNGQALDLQKWLSEHRVSCEGPVDWLSRGGTAQKWVFPTCPWNSDHTNRSAYVAQFPNGAIEAGCLHESCKGRTWRDLRRIFEPERMPTAVKPTCRPTGTRPGQAHAQTDAAETSTTAPVDDACQAQDDAQHIADNLTDAELADLRQNSSIAPQDARPDSKMPTGGGNIILPSGSTRITDTANGIFKRAARTRTLFTRGGAVATVRPTDAGPLEIEIVRPAAARSLLEKYAKFWAWRAGAKGEPVLKSAILAEDMARALLESEQARKLLPPINGLVGCPVLFASGEIAGKGYHASSGLLVTAGEMPPDVPIFDAIHSLLDLLSEYDFQTPSDKARALAMMITPSLKLGGHLLGNVPADIAEADQSQAGKTYRQKITAAIYNERPALVTEKSGGVGSVDESFNSQLAAGRPFLQLDNFRGKYDSPHIEAFLTAEKTFPVRLPHCREITIDPSLFFVLMTSNGVETTRDFANRSSFVRIKKRVGYSFRSFDQGDLLQHVRAQQPYYLGCVFSVVRRWIKEGCPRTSETRHDFREWCGVLDWIVQSVCGQAPLMDGHQAAQVRVSDPSLTFLRRLALAVAEQKRLAESLIASQLYEICELADISVPGLHEPDEAHGRRQIGIVLGRVFKTANVVEVDGFSVERDEIQTHGEESRVYWTKQYKFSASKPKTPQAPQAPQDPECRGKVSLFSGDSMSCGGSGGSGESDSHPPLDEEWASAEAMSRDPRGEGQ